MENMELRICTLNCWGIPLVSKDRPARMRAIAEVFAQKKFDVVCLQEVWSEDDFNMISIVAKDALPYGHYFHSGVFGSGVCMLSKYIIKETFFHKWAVNGYIHKIQHGDWFGGKGVGLCRIQVGGFLINVYTAHLHAEYNRQADDYKVHRALQAFETAQFIRITSDGANGVVLAGDLNTEPEDLEYRLLLSACGLEDSYMIRPSSRNFSFGTNECSRNSYTEKKAANDNPEGKRIDYILFRAGIRTKCQLTDYCLPLSDRVPLENFSYSDHEAVQVNLEFTEDLGIKGNETVEQPTNTESGPESLCQVRNRLPSNTCQANRRIRSSVSYDDSHNMTLLMALKESMDICEKYLVKLRSRRTLLLFTAVVLLMCIMGTALLEEYIGPYYRVPILIFNVFLAFCCFYCFLMGTFWNCIERNATIAGIKSMRIFYNYVKLNDED